MGVSRHFTLGFNLFFCLHQNQKACPNLPVKKGVIEKPIQTLAKKGQTVRIKTQAQIDQEKKQLEELCKGKDKEQHPPKDKENQEIDLNAGGEIVETEEDKLPSDFSQYENWNFFCNLYLDHSSATASKKATHRLLLRRRPRNKGNKEEGEGEQWVVKRRFWQEGSILDQN